MYSVYISLTCWVCCILLSWPASSCMWLLVWLARWAPSWNLGNLTVQPAVAKVHATFLFGQISRRWDPIDLESSTASPHEGQIEDSMTCSEEMLLNLQDVRCISHSATDIDWLHPFSTFGHLSTNTFELQSLSSIPDSKLKNFSMSNCVRKNVIFTKSGVIMRAGSSFAEPGGDARVAESKVWEWWVVGSTTTQNSIPVATTCLVRFSLAHQADWTLKYWIHTRYKL